MPKNSQTIQDDTPTVMWAEDYERLQEKKRQERLQAERERIAKEQADQKAYEDALPFKNKLQFNETLAQEICERVSAGELTINIVQELNMPTMRRLNQWLKNEPEFKQIYNESLDDRLSIFEEQVIQIADDMANDFKEITRNGKTSRVPDPEVIARARLRVEVRFKHLKAGKPQKWGDSSTLITKQDGEDPAQMTNEELERRLHELENKNKIVKVV